MACDGYMVAYLRWWRPLSFLRYKFMGMRLAIASTPSDGDMRKAPVIHKAALHCIFFSSVMFFIVGALLKNHNWKPYKAIGMMHVLYRRRFCVSKSPLDELPSIFMALRVERHLVA